MDPSDAQASAVQGPSDGSKGPASATAEPYPQHKPQQASSAQAKPDWHHLTDLMSDMGLNQLDHLSWADQCDTILGCGSEDGDQSSGDDQPEALSGGEDSAHEMLAADMLLSDASDAAAAQQDQQQDDSEQLQQESSYVDQSTTQQQQQQQQLNSVTDDSASEDLPQCHNLGLFSRSRRRMTCTGDDDEGSSDDDVFSSKGPQITQKPAADLLMSRASAPAISRTISLASWLSSRQHASSHTSSSSGLDAAPPSSHRARSILSLGFRQHHQLQQQGSSSRAGSSDAGAAAAAKPGAAAGSNAFMQQAAAQAADASQQSNEPVGLLALLTGKKLSRQPQPQAQAGSQASVPRGHKRSTRHKYQTEAAQLASLLEESEQDFSAKCAEVRQMKQQMMTLQDQLAPAQHQAQQASSAPRLSYVTAEGAISTSESMLAAHRELMSQQLQLFEAWQAADGEASQMRLQISELQSQHDDAMAAALKRQHDLLASNADLMQRLHCLKARADADAAAGQQAEAQQSTSHTLSAADGGPHQGQQRQELAALESQHETEIAALQEKLRQQEADASEALADERKVQQCKLALQLAATQQALEKKHQQELAQAAQKHEQQHDAAVAAVRNLYEQQYAAKLQAVVQQHQEELEHQASQLQQKHEAAQARIAREAAQQRGAVQQQLQDMQAQLVTSRKRAIVAQNCLSARSDELQQERAKRASMQLELAEAVAAIACTASARGAAVQQLADAQQQAQEASDAMRRADIKAAGADLARASAEAARQGAEERCRVLQHQLTAEVAGAQAAREALSGLEQRHRQVEQQLEARQESNRAGVEGSNARISQLSAQLDAAQDDTAKAQQQLQQATHSRQELKAQYRRHTGRMVRRVTQLLSDMFDKMNGAFSHAHAITAAHAASQVPPDADGGNLDDQLPSPMRRRALKAQQLRHQQQLDAAALASWQQLQSAAGELLGEGTALFVAQIKQLQAMAVQEP
jgi:hypothetical protein